MAKRTQRFSLEHMEGGLPLPVPFGEFGVGPVMFEMPSDHPSEGAENKVFGAYLGVAHQIFDE